jgi:hypothetical protein
MEGQGSNVQGNSGVLYISYDFGKTIGWQIKEGRDFSRDFPSDSAALIINESFAKFTGLKHPVGENIRWNHKDYRIVGVVKDMLMESPYEPVFRTVFLMSVNPEHWINIRINPQMNMHDAIAKIEPVFKSYNPAEPFEYRFTDEEFARKFGDEERTGKLAGSFAILAIFIKGRKANLKRFSFYFAF